MRRFHETVRKDRLVVRLEVGELVVDDLQRLKGDLRRVFRNESVLGKRRAVLQEARDVDILVAEEIRLRNSFDDVALASQRLARTTALVSPCTMSGFSLM